MFPFRRSRRTAAFAALLAVAAVAGGVLWWRTSRPFLDRWGPEATGLVSPARIGTQIEVLSSKPHRSGTPANDAVGAEVERRLAAAGLKPWSDVHDADLWEPVTLRLALAGPGGREIELHEREVPGDPATRAVKDELPFLAYAPDADVEAPLVYANFGAAEDYDVLRKAGVDPRGKVALVHVQGVCRGEKVAAAERAGVAALLIYLEPKDQGIVKPAYPAGSGPHPAAVSRGSLLKYFRRPGDPRRAKEQGVDILPKIPALAISAEAAGTLLREMTGPEPPKDWKGSLDAPYALGPGKARVRLTVRGRIVRAKLRNVLASIPGADPKAPQVLVMGHYDAWVNGAVDPGSGAAVVLEVADVLARLAEKGWTPTRGVLFALWDGEEWGMFGSTAWVEAHLGSAGLPVAAAVNVDSGARANDLYAMLTPGLRGDFDEVLRRVGDPLSEGKTLADSAGQPSLPGFSSDAAPFLGFTPVPTADLGFGRWYGAYHTAYDTPAYVAKISDPGFVRCAALARAVALFAGALATPRVFPFRFGEVAAFTQREIREIQARYPGAMAWLPSALNPLDARLSAFAAAAASWDAWARSRSGGEKERARADGIAALAIGSLGGRGAFGRGCVLWGPSETAGCGATALPGLEETVRRGDRAGAAREIDRMSAAFSRSRDYLAAGEGAARGTTRKRPPGSRRPGEELSRRGAAAALVLAVAAEGCGRSPHADRSTRVAEHVNGARIGARIEALAAVPHRAGTPAQASVVETVAEILRAGGLNVTVSSFGVDLPEPGEAALALEGAPAFELRELPLPGDPYSADGARETPFFAWAPPGEVQGRVVYANHGDRGDYALLAKAGVSVKGAIVLARAGGICRSMKSLLAEEAGAAGLLLYPERRDLGIVKPDFPDGPYLNPRAVPRGSMLRYFRYPGDPAGARARAAPDLLPRIPALPISETVAREILERVEGRPAPEDWTGWMKTPYRVGATRGQARLTVRGATRRVTLRNLFATLPGRRRDAAAVVVSAHTDAWVHGAIDPVSGVATVLEAADVLARLAAGGWRPERDVVFAFWDGEEYGMLGSTRWVEERLADLPARVAAFLYVDSSARAWDFMADVSPGLADSLDEILATVPDPATGRPLLSVRATVQLPGFSGDTAPFVGLGGVPGAQVGYGRRTYAMYHTGYDDPLLARRHLDPGWGLSSSLARVLSVWASTLADAPVPPWRFTEVADFLGKEIGGLGAGAAERFPQKHELVYAVARFREAAVSWDDVGVAFRGARASDLEPIVLSAMAAFRDLPGARDFARSSLLLGPSAETGCGTETVPGLRRALLGDGSTRQEAERLLRALAASESRLREAARLAGGVR